MVIKLNQNRYETQEHNSKNLKEIIFNLFTSYFTLVMLTFRRFSYEAINNQVMAIMITNSILNIVVVSKIINEKSKQF